MRQFHLFPFTFAVIALTIAAGFAAAPAQAQTWSVEEPGAGVASAKICPIGEEGSADFLCFRLECSALEPLHFALDVAGRAAASERLAVTVGVDGGDVGVLTFAPHETTGYTRYTARFDPEPHEELVDLLQRGLRASLSIAWPDGVQDVEMGLTGSADSLYTAMQACPAPTPPAPPVDNPASLVLGEVVAACNDFGGTVAMEPGFERREDLDGDGREDLVIDYAAAVCTEAATLNCNPGGCTVGFFLARDAGYTRMFSDVIRGYEIIPGGFLALDLHGTACGLYGFEACRKVFDVAGDAPVLVEEIAGPEAETVAIVGTPVADEPAVEETTAEDAVDGDDAVIALTDDTTVEAAPEDGEGAVAENAVPDTDAPVAEEAPAVAETAPEAAPETPVETLAETPVETPAETPEEVVIAAVDPQEAAPADAPVAEPATAVETAVEPTMESAEEPAPSAPVVTAAATMTGDPDDGPTSRHDAGPAPAVPEDARFRGDGTLIVPEEAAQ